MAAEPPPTRDVPWVGPAEFADIPLNQPAELAALNGPGARLGSPSTLAQAAATGPEVCMAEADRFAASILPVIQCLQRAGVTSYRGIAATLLTSSTE